MAQPGGASPADPDSSTEPLITQEFGRRDLGSLRHRVAACAAEAGLVGVRLQGFVLAVNEITTNAVIHGGGLGRLRLWLSARQLVCEITDTGPGMPGGRLPPHRQPPPEAQGGRGLWLTRTLCDAFSVRTGGFGTTVRLATGLPLRGWVP
jgi:anti-sigma regulatory factor (Ser/Thr protein kinase)